MSLTTSYLTRLSVAEHDGTTRQILGKLQGSSIDNEVFLQSVAGVAACSQAEDDAYTRSLKDFNSDRLKKEDEDCDCYTKAVRAILNGYTQLPDSEPKKQTGLELVQVFKDYNFSPSDTYTSEADKIRNMNQVYQTRIADLQALGIAEYWAQAVAHAANMEQLLSQRFDDIAARVVGELKTARANTDAAIKKAYEVISAMNIMTPSTAISDLIAQLEAIETYAWQYYLGGRPTSSSHTSSTSGGDSTENGGGTSSGTTDPGNGGTTETPTDPTTPDNPTPDNPGGGDNGGDNGGGGGTTVNE